MQKMSCCVFALCLLLCCMVPAVAQTTTTLLDNQTTVLSTTTATTTAESGETGTVTDTATTVTTEAPPPPTDPIIPHITLLDSNGLVDKALQWEGKTGRNPVKPEWEQTDRGQAVRFNGETTNFWLDIKDNIAPFTLSLWVNWQPVEETKLNQRLFTLVKQGTAYEIGVSPWIQRESEKGETVNGIAMEYGSVQGEQWQRATAYYPAWDNMSNGLSDRVWHHISLTVEQQALYVYVDGVLWKKTELPYAYEVLGIDRLILGGADNNTSLFQGVIQDCRLYEGALNATQIGRLRQGKDPFDATLAVETPSYEHIAAPEGLLYDKVYELKAVLADKKPVIQFTGDTALGFLEKPTVGMGQSVSGSFTLKNTSKQMVHLYLDAITLPVATTPEWKYLSEVHVVLSGAVHFSGAFTELTPERLQLDYPYMRDGETQTVQFTVSRPIHSVTAVSTADTPWTVQFSLPRTSNALPKESNLFWVLLPVALGLILLGFSVYWTVTRRLPPWFMKLWKKR